MEGKSIQSKQKTTKTRDTEKGKNNKHIIKTYKKKETLKEQNEDKKKLKPIFVRWE